MKALAIAAVTAAAVIAAGCGGAVKPYPPEFVQSFLVGCESQSAAQGRTLADGEAYCRCVIERLERNVAYTEAAAFEAEIELGGRPARTKQMAADTAACAGR